MCVGMLGYGQQVGSTHPTASSFCALVEVLISPLFFQLDKFILLGHSFGGYLASAYAIRYPNRLHHLVLADPWGFPEKPPDLDRNGQVPIWIKMVAAVMQPFNPLAGLRAAGPWGK